MKIHEYQAREIFTRYAIPVTNSIVCYNMDDVTTAGAK